MTNQIDLLKKVKVPLWASLVGRFRALLRRRVARKEIHHIVVVKSWNRIIGTGRFIQIFYTLKEKGNGKRSYVCRSSILLSPGEEETTWEFINVVEPWLMGKFDNQQVIEWASKQAIPEEVKKQGWAYCVK